MTEIIVVGNGIVGMSIAMELAERGHRVSLAGDRARIIGASVAAGAMLGCFAESTSSCIATEQGARKLRAAVAARALWDGRLARLEDLTGTRVDYSADGTVVMLNAVGTEAIDSENFAAIRAAAALYDEPLESIDPRDLPWIDPEDLARPLEALFLPRERALDARPLIAALDRALITLGVTILDVNTKEVVLLGNRIVGIRDDRGVEHSAEHIVLAAGTNTSGLLAAIGAEASKIPPILSGIGTATLVDTRELGRPSSVLRTPNRAFACGLHLVPHSQGRVYLGATNVLATESHTQPEIGDLIFLLDCAVRQLHRGLRTAQVARCVVGNRPVPVDGYPLIGAAGPDGLWIASGTYRDGLHLSPLIASAIADRIERPSHSDDLDSFAPVRPPISDVPRSSVIDATVSHMLATGVETMWRTPVNWPPLFGEHIHRAFGLAASALSDTVTPPPDVLALCTDRPRAMQIVRDYYRAWRHDG
ncbi:NAD(P)/FAD-dependent oxidoreductase [Rathayibacter toxicus]|uniref:FAD-dependent oxidoreductase n=1 Tax=Rathayibacter toxicus TaxID=145458 RepID=A0A0C5BHR3_9MICO|nr:FAD-dependent oxidoreductase [Rathayibacter toxicus]AJM77815.1 hypothetical protein TI83_07375 [Rathayibacter toxicus]ALS58002.1 hypothetical protein APU90_09700 [Rathayibacter toxicus]KKM44288.1 hypothetical protein VT73_10320 [Rathayibacter toxicus]PPG20312.1 FAD-dependent oxidoreductase [Rathayibacter toxicus]PPG45413.1 FAD-dependent oxidoreductase [Rathayibacter toxicus]